jgi:hypothetical protein
VIYDGSRRQEVHLKAPGLKKQRQKEIYSETTYRPSASFLKSASSLTRISGGVPLKEEKEAAMSEI